MRVCVCVFGTGEEEKEVIRDRDSSRQQTHTQGLCMALQTMMPRHLFSIFGNRCFSCEVFITCMLVSCICPIRKSVARVSHLSMEVVSPGQYWSGLSY